MTIPVYRYGPNPSHVMIMIHVLLFLFIADSAMIRAFL